MSSYINRNPFLPVGNVSRYSSYPTPRPSPFDMGGSPPSPAYSSAMPDSPAPIKQGPSFNETQVFKPLLVGGTNGAVEPQISAKIPRGFFPIEGHWTCYRRNYFAVACSFSLRNYISGMPLYLQHDGVLCKVRSFAVAISATIKSQDEHRQLVQHTPKRDRKSERMPSMVQLQPTTPGSTGTFSTAVDFGSALHLDYHPSSYPTASNPQPLSVPFSHTYERIQFQKATANNGSRRAQQQYYRVVVELHATVVDPRFGTTTLQIARRVSDPVVVRGRSPGHYRSRDQTVSNGRAAGSAYNGFPQHKSTLSTTSGTTLYEGASAGDDTTTPFDLRRMQMSAITTTSTEQPPSLASSPLVSSSSSSSAFDYAVDPLDPSSNGIRGRENVETYNDHQIQGQAQHPAVFTPISANSPGRRPLSLPLPPQLDTKMRMMHGGSTVTPPTAAFSKSYDDPSLTNNHNHYDVFLRRPTTADSNLFMAPPLSVPGRMMSGSAYMPASATPASYPHSQSHLPVPSAHAHDPYTRFDAMVGAPGVLT